MEHTAGDWRICEHGNSADRICIEKVGGGWFLELTPGYPLSEFPDPVSVAAEFEANAKRIVLAVNAHDDLVAALKLARSMLPKFDPELADAPLYAQIETALLRSTVQR